MSADGSSAPFTGHLARQARIAAHFIATGRALPAEEGADPRRDLQVRGPEEGVSRLLADGRELAIRYRLGSRPAVYWLDVGRWCRAGLPASLVPQQVLLHERCRRASEAHRLHALRAAISKRGWRLRERGYLRLDSFVRELLGSGTHESEPGTTRVIEVSLPAGRKYAVQALTTYHARGRSGGAPALEAWLTPAGVEHLLGIAEAAEDSAGALEVVLAVGAVEGARCARFKVAIYPQPVGLGDDLAF